MEQEERLTNLEIKLSYMEDFMNQIQEVAVEQAKEIERLKVENKLLSEKMNELIENSGEEIPNRKPPHY
ncbi:MAG: SlyX family protein [Treponema sp.]|nr:SlyX family protein [Treponema sp.]